MCSCSGAKTGPSLKVVSKTDNVEDSVLHHGHHPGNVGVIGKCIELGEIIYEPDLHSNEDFCACLEGLDAKPIWHRLWSVVFQVSAFQ